MSSDRTSDSGSDIVLIDRDDFNDFNPDHIFPLSASDIAKIRSWLQPTAYDDPFGEYRKHLASHAPGTGIWLTSSAKYGEWLRNQQVGTLWVKGIPGSGKSVIAAHLIHELATQHPGSPVLYIFSRQIIDANHDPVALLHDWLDQLLTYSPPLQHCLDEYVKEGRPLDTLPIDDLWRHLRYALGKLPNTTYCVVDALDEMDRGHDDFLQTLAGLGLWKPSKVKVLMTSRPIARLEAVLRKAEMLQIRLDETAVDKDISAFVQGQLNLVSITDSERELIMEAVPGRANGLFLYARLAMDAFLKPGANIRHVLATLPQDLNDMYTDLLAVHSLRSGVPPDIQRLIFQFATHASRPLRLIEVAEILERTCFSQAGGDFKEKKEMVRAACGPLLEILLDETVCVVHHSFTEYLMDSSRPDTSNDYPPLKQGPTHNTLALICLSYLEYVLSAVKSQLQGWPENPKSIPLALRRIDDVPYPGKTQLRLKYPFFEYAAANWCVHVTKSTLAGYDQDQVNRTLRRLFGDDAQLSIWVHLAWPGSAHGIRGFTQLHVAAGLGLDHYLQDILKTGDIDVDSRDVLGRTPIWWAASFGHAGAVRLLAQAGANPDQADNYHGCKPLHMASMANHAKAVQVLIECGVSPVTMQTGETRRGRRGPWRSSIGDTPLMYACQYGHLETVDVFMTCISDPNLVRQALEWATMKGHSVVIRRILKHPQANAKAKERGSRLLASACLSGSADSVAALLEAGVDPNVDQHPHDSGFTQGLPRMSPLRNSPLRSLCALTQTSQIYEDRVQTIFSLLMAAGVNVHERDQDGANALHWATNSPVLTRLLIEAGVDVNVTSSDGATPLHKTKDREVTDLLVRLGGVDINKRDKAGRTPLLSCLSRADPYSGGHNSFEQGQYGRLLDFRPDCSVVDNQGNNVIHYFLRRESSMDMTETLGRLLALGADPNCRNSAGELPLHGLPHRLVPVEKIFDLLLDAGADLDARDRQGSTILFRAVDYCRQGSWSLLKLLIEKGALATVRDFQGRTLLHEAIKRWPPFHSSQRTEGLDLLLECGLDPTVADNHGNNLLHELAIGSRNHDEHLWKKLLALGLDLNQRNCEGRTPLHLLCSTRSPLDCVDFVISEMRQAGTTSFDVADNAGITPLHLASTVSSLHVRKLLDAGADATRATYEGRTPLHLAAQSRAGNTVGILLDALCRSKAETEAEAEMLGRDTRDSAAAFVPRGSWYRDKTFHMLPEIINAQEIPRGSDLREPGWTPLHYACRSGRPETVALLLQAGAHADPRSILTACSKFEEEQWMWERNPENEDDLVAGGLLLTDTSRPVASAPGLRISQEEHALRAQAARIDDILEMIWPMITQLDDNQTMVNDWRAHLIQTAYRKHQDYTAQSLVASQIEYGGPRGQESEPGRFSSYHSRYVREAALRSVAEYEIAKDGECKEGQGSKYIFQCLMLRREYGAARELARAGLDSFEGDNFQILVQLGFASLARGIIDDLWPGSDKTAAEERGPTPACNSQLSTTRIKSDCFADSTYLLTAVRQELPNMEMVRLLVEDCGVDMNKLHMRSGRAKADLDSVLLSVASGEQWWHAALALPYFIDRSADLNIRNHLGQTPLHVALGGGPFRDDVARALITGGSDVNAVDAEGRSCLTYAGGDAQLSRLLLENGAKGDAQTLFPVIDGNNHETLRVLLSAGIDPNLRLLPHARQRHAADKMYLSAVHYAARMRDGELYDIHTEDQAFLQIRKRMVETLLEHGADPFAACLQRSIDDQRTKTPEDLDVAALLENDQLPLPEGYVRSTVLHTLVQESRLVEPFFEIATLEVDRRDPNGKTLLLAACSSVMGPDSSVDMASSPPPGEDAAIAKQSILKYLLSKGADPLARDGQDRNALHHMLTDDRAGYSRNRQDSLLYMVDKHPNLLNQSDKMGNTPLHLAFCQAGARPARTRKSIELTMLLIRAGADPLRVNGDGDSSLHLIASRLYDPEIRQLFQYLVKRGCDIKGRNNRGETPIFRYYTSGHNPLYTKSAYQTEVDALFEALDADYHVCDVEGRGLLHVAARKSAQDFQLLLDKGLDPKMEDLNKRTPLDVAAACGNKDILELFARDKE
ncbi:ankyrin repeat-containing domain protein [Xylariaceae sp. FL0594]|nr:ankyrin repeat-containing domain protein [Xylariaceae sp. FL0594]